MFSIQPILAMAPPGGQGASGTSLIANLLPIALVFGVFYFLIIMPARKRQKKHQEMIDALKNGDRIVTNGGIYGTVVGVDDQKVQLRIADQVRIEIAKSAVAGMQERPE